MADIYRDRSEGTAARRQELLRRRRDELVTMPHAVRRVVVARSARVAAGMMATAAGVALIVAAASPALAARLADALPGPRPAPLSTLLFAAWMLALVAWAISRARVEHRFAVAMSRFVLPSDDVDHDVERLDHERPDAIARTMGHQLEVRSAAWPMLAAGVLVPATGLWLAGTVRAGGWSIGAVEDDLTRHASALIALGVVGAITAVALTRKAVRQPSITLAALVAAAATGGVAFLGFAQHSTIGWAFAGVAAAAIGVAAIARVLDHERALLEVDDPAAGSELFTLRGAMRAARAKLAIVRAALLRVRPRYVLLIAAASIISVGIGLAAKPRARGPLPLIAAIPAPAVAAPAGSPVRAPGQLVEAPRPVAEAHPPYVIERTGNRFVIEARLDVDGHLRVPMTGFAVVPQDWRAVVDVDYSDGEPIMVQLGGETQRLDSRRPSVRFTIDACHGSRPLELDLQRPEGLPLAVRLFVRPMLTVADCRR